MDVIVWILCALAYLAALVWLGFRTLNNGHTVLFILGLFMPLLWILGVLLPPTHDASAARARANLR
jgi:hypothetical protein